MRGRPSAPSLSLPVLSDLLGVHAAQPPNLLPQLLPRVGEQERGGAPVVHGVDQLDVRPDPVVPPAGLPQGDAKAAQLGAQPIDLCARRHGRDAPAHRAGLVLPGRAVADLGADVGVLNHHASPVRMYLAVSATHPARPAPVASTRRARCSISRSRRTSAASTRAASELTPRARSARRRASSTSITVITRSPARR